MNYLKIVVPLLAILISLSLSPTKAAAQQSSRRELEVKRKQILKDIKKKSSQLEETKKTKVGKLKEKVQLDKQVKKQEQVVGNLQTEVHQLSKSINRNTAVSEALNLDIQRLTREYSERARRVLREKINPSVSFFSVAMPFFPKKIDADYQHRQYLRQYDQFRQKEASYIVATQKILSSKIAIREHQKENTGEKLTVEEAEKKQLHGELKQTDQQLKSLSATEQKLRKELEEQEKIHEKLNSAIEIVIKNEISARRTRDKSRPAPVGQDTEATAIVETPEFNALSSDFKNNRGKLPWPVQKGAISRRFGLQSHPTLKDVQIHNHGIDIATEPNANVRAVCKGKIISTQFFPGLNNVVIAQHGNYYTVYSNLEVIKVRRGDELQAKQIIGQVAAPKDGSTQSQLHFEVWQEKQRLNPADWIGK